MRRLTEKILPPPSVRKHLPLHGISANIKTVSLQSAVTAIRTLQKRRSLTAKKEVDPDKSKNNGKNYLNAQLGKAMFKNKVTAGSVEIEKVDNYNHPLEGAVFTLQKADESWNGTGEATELTTTKEDPGSDESPATPLFKNLKPGKYIIKEKSAPDIFR